MFLVLIRDDLECGCVFCGLRCAASAAHDGGKLGLAAQLEIRVSETHMGRIEDTHMIVCHMISYFFMDREGECAPA